VLAIDVDYDPKDNDPQRAEESAHSWEPALGRRGCDAADADAAPRGPVAAGHERQETGVSRATAQSFGRLASKGVRVFDCKSIVFWGTDRPPLFDMTHNHPAKLRVVVAQHL